MTKTVVTVVGARPQFVKAAIVSRALRVAGVTEHLVHSGQHYDHSMSGRFLEELGIDVAANLNVGSGNHARQTAQMMVALQGYLEGMSRLPDGMMVYGDTNSTLAAALVASKLGIQLVHVEAGLRSFNRSMPEEVNRVVTDHLSSILFCSSDEGKANLESEGISSGVHVVGDVMYDAFEYFSSHSPTKDSIAPILGVDLQAPYILMTLHRPSNTDAPQFLPKLFDLARCIDEPIVWPVHPRFRAAVEKMDLPRNVLIIEPVGYFEMLRLLEGCRHVITDSGGLQKEAYWARRLCITLRSETEWVETLRGGWNVLADLQSDIPLLLERHAQTEWVPLYGDGQASARVAQIVSAKLGQHA